MTRMTAFLALSVAFLISSNSYAVGNRGEMISDNQAKRAGMKIAWETHITVDSSLSKFGNIFQYVGPNKFEVRFELTYAGFTQVISESDLDKSGNRIGIARASELAQQRLASLQRLEFKDAKITRIEKPLPPKITLYSTNSSRTVHAVDGTTGRTLWKTRVGKINRPSWVTANDRKVIVVNGITVFCLDAKDGKLLWQRICQGMPGSRPSVTNLHAFVSMYNGTIQSFPLVSGKANTQQIISPGRVSAMPMVSENTVAWANKKGYVNIAATEGFEDGIRFRVKTGSNIVCSPTYHYQAPKEKDGKAKKSIYVGTLDGDVFSISESGADINWEFPTGFSIRQSPIAYGNKLYVVCDNRTLIQIDAESGIETWRSSGIERVISASKKKIYCVNTTGRIQILGVDNGRKIGELPTEVMEIKVENTKNDRVYVGTRRGLFQCLHEVENEKPIFHIPIPTERPVAIKQKKPTEKGTGKAVEEPGAKPTVADPFGEAKAGADPFGADDKGKAKVDPDDPFGDK